jgi:hypothetical protein
VFTLLTLSLVTLGIWPVPLITVAGLVLLLGWFWLAVYELVAETRSRVRGSSARSIPAAGRLSGDPPRNG